jgi:protein-L-isoaspartate(D-aspartate) O-methyltransferase
MGDDPARLMRFVLEMRQEGVTHARVLSAMERTPRSHYAPAHMEGLALENVILPLAHGQTMTKPSVIGRMVAALDPQPGECVLEIGTGSGYQSAVLGVLAGRVVTLERWSDLVADARERFGLARVMNVFAHVADGAEGWAESAPYDRIILNISVDAVPPALFEQLRPGGVLLAPVDDRLIRFKGDTREDLGPVSLPKLMGGLAEES